MGHSLPLSTRLRFGPLCAVGDREQALGVARSLSDWGYGLRWAGDHIAFTGPMNDPLTQLAYLAALDPQPVYGTSIYLLPLRHPTVVAKMVATVDRLMGGPRRFIFAVGVGGEFPAEYEACGVPLGERGGRANEAIGVLKRLWTEDEVEHRGKYFSFGPITMAPRPATPGGPPIWVGGRRKAALLRAARLGDGWIPYAVTPARYAEGLQFIAQEAERNRRKFERFGTGLHLFLTMGPSYDHALEVAAQLLSRRYRMDFREPARRYAALGKAADVAERIGEFARAGARDFALDVVGRPGELEDMLERFAREVIPLLGGDRF
jgi:alkanesulfonate monooxygenase SsuD/methylene tetrahydromethanopterin reductase-like flavin-dependent oxidoreductase (luciferase family)